MILTPMTDSTFEPTPKAPGHKVISLHRVFVINERGGSEPVRNQPEYVAAPPVTPWSVLQGHGWEALAGVALGALILTLFILFMSLGA